MTLNMGNTWRLILLLIMPLTVTSQSFQCPTIKDGDNTNKETVQISNRCYWFQPENNLQWIEAYNWCKYGGGYLVKFETAEEEENVTDYISQEFTNEIEFWTSGKCPDHQEIQKCNNKNNWFWITSDDDSGDAIKYSNWYPGEPNPGTDSQDKSYCLILRKHDTSNKWEWYDENYDKKTGSICEFDPVYFTTITLPTYTSKSSVVPSTPEDQPTSQTDSLATDAVFTSVASTPIDPATSRTVVRSTDAVPLSPTSAGFSTQSSTSMATINTVTASSRNNALWIGLGVPFSVLVVAALIVTVFVVVKRRKTQSDDKGTMDNDGDDGSKIDVKNIAYESVMNLSPIDAEHDTKYNYSAEQNIYTQHDVDDTVLFIDTHNIIYEPYDTTGNNEESKTNQ